MDKKTFAGRLEVKLLDTGGVQEKTFSGYGAVFNNTDAYGDVIAPGAFTKTLAEYKANGGRPALLWNHDSFSMPIGVWTSLEEDANGLKAEGVFVDTQSGNDAYILAKSQAVTGLSIGYVVTGFDMTTIGGKTIRTITEIKLYEISLVTFPANDLARVEDVKNQENNVNNEVKAALEAEIAEIKAKLAALEAKMDSGDDASEDCDCDPEDDACDCDNEENSDDVSEEKSAIEALTTLIYEVRGVSRYQF